MNRPLYRIEFNASAGVQTAVAKNTRTPRQSAGSSLPVTLGKACCALRPISSAYRFTALVISLALMQGSATLVQAQMVADPKAAGQQRPVIDNSANGLPLVQIAPPNANGLSHNQYQQFNVGASGAILNNASAHVNTQLGGWVGANPNLSGASASLILNEVTSTARSQLNGYLEVAGQRADVIVANPNGISCSGCGFINTNRGMLTTGTPVFGGSGSLEAFRVTQGTLDIGPGGFNDTASAQVDLIARSVQVNGQLHANALNLVAGANEVNYAALGVQIIQGLDGAPTVAIDVAALGGLYANKIWLIGTEAGVGVASYGNMASAGDFQIDATGKLTLAGHTSSAGHLTVAAQDGIDHSGITYAKQNTSLTSAATITNSGTIGAQGNTTLTGHRIASTGSLGAGIDTDGKLSGSGNLHVRTTQSLTATGQNLAAQELIFSGANVDLHGATTQAGGNITITASAGDIDNQDGQLTAAGSMDLHASETVNNRGGHAGSGNWLRLQASGLDNTNGRLESNGTGNLDLTSAVTNTNGKMHSAAHLTLRASTLLGEGATSAGGDLSITLSGDYTQSAANIFSAVGNLEFSTTGMLTNDGSFTGGNNTIVHANSIVNQSGGLFNSNALTALSATDSLINAGRIYGHAIALSGHRISNDQDAVIAARNTLDLGAQTIINREHALLKSEGDMAIGGTLDAHNKATGMAASITNSSATIDSGGKLAIASAHLLNTNAHFASEIELDPSQTRSWIEYELDGDPTVLSADEAHTENESDVTKLVINATGSRHNDYTTRRITATTSRTVVTHTDPGQILARGDMLLTGGRILNDKSVIVAGGTLSGNIDGLDNGGSNPQGETFVHQDIISTHHTTEKCTAGTKRCNKEDTSHLQIDLPLTHFDLGIWRAVAQTPPDSVGNPAQGQTVRPINYQPGSVVPQFGLPNNELYRTVTTPGLHYLIATDPAYTQYRNYLSSDYLLGRLSLDTQAIQKRLGDGYYEQKLINDQILQLTGSPTLGAYVNNEAQYQALMDAGVAYAQQFELIPGMALSAAHMAALTTDLVWLVEQTITLADGSTQQVLAPVLYLSKLRGEDVKPTGALIAADTIHLQLHGSLDNAGTLNANKQLIINAGQDINNRLGTLNSQGDTLLMAGRDINNQSGTIGADRLAMLAGRDIRLETLTNSSTNNTAQSRISPLLTGNHTGTSSTQIALDRISTIQAGTVTAQAQRDLDVSAAVIASSGDTSLMAGRDLNLHALTTQEELNVTYDSKNHLYKRQEQAHGSVLQSGGNTTLAAGRDLNSQAAYINAEQDLNVLAGGTIHLGSATQSSNYDQEIHVNTDNLISTNSKHIRDQQSTTQAIGSTLSGDKVTVQAGQDLHVIGSHIVASKDIDLTAANVNLLTSQNSVSQTYRKEETTSGVFSGGGIGVTVGVKTEEHANTNRHISNNASTIGSTDGNIRIRAGNSYTQTGSDVLALTGDIDIAAQAVTINQATDTNDSTQESKFKQTGITIAVTSPVLSALQSGQQMRQAASKTTDTRMQALAAGSAALAAANTYDTLQKANSPLDAISLSISAGTSKNESHSQQSSSTTRGANVNAGGNLNISATGGGTASDLTIQGSELRAGKNVTLQADHNVQLLAAQNTRAQHSSNSNSSASVGATVSASGNLSYQASAAAGKGHGDGNEVTQVNTHINAANQLTIRSGSDTTLRGASASGQQVTLAVGTSGSGNLHLESQQDSSTYQGRQQSYGASVSAGTGSASGSINASRSNVDGDYASVNEQTGILAGNDGFSITVNGNTHLTGAKIASTEQAVQNGHNSLSTQTLTQSRIENHDDYQAESMSAGLSVSHTAAQPIPGQPGEMTDAKTAMNGTGVGYGSKNGSNSSSTGSGISSAVITISDAAAQEAKTGNTVEQTLAEIDSEVRSDKDSSNKLNKNWDGQQLMDDVSAQAQITQAFGQQAAKAIGDLATSKLNELNRQIKAEPDATKRAALQAEAEKWGENGAYRVLLHTATGALTGGLAGAAGAATASLTMRAMAEQIDKMDLPDGLKQGLAQIAAGAMGAAVGGNAGLAAAVNVEANNRQLHPREISWLEKNKEDAAQLLSEKLGRPVSQEEALRYLTMAGEGNVDEAYQRANGNNLGAQTSEERYAYNLAKQYIAANANGGFIDDSGQSQQLFVAKGNDFYNANIYSEYKNDQAYRDFYWNTMGDNLKPDNPTAAELALYQEREIIRLTNAAKDALSGAIPGIMAGAAGTIVKNSGQSKNTANSNKIDQAASSTGTESVKGANSAGVGAQTSEERYAYNLAKQYIAANANGGFIDDSGQSQQLFVAKGTRAASWVLHRICGRKSRSHP